MLYLSKVFFSDKSKMSGKKDTYLKPLDIKLEPAPRYPGKWNKNHKQGSVLTRSEFIENEVRKWVNALAESEKYQATALSAKTIMLCDHLKKLNVSYSHTMRYLVKIESEIEKPDEDDGDTDQVSDQDEGDGNNNEMEVDEPIDLVETNVMESRALREMEVTRAMQMDDVDLFADETNVSQVVKDSTQYKERKSVYTEHFVEDKFDQASSQDILMQLSQVPKVVGESDLLRRKIEHLSKTKKSEKRLVKTLNETLHKLRENPGHEARNQEKIIVAAANDTRFGDPGLDVSGKLKKIARKTKLEFLTGDRVDLKPDKFRSKDFFPETVKDLAEKCWREQCTIVEPAKHGRPGTAVKDADETRPTIYQIISDQECYDEFKEHFENSVRSAMKGHVDLMKAKMVNDSDTERKRNRMGRLDRKLAVFPGKTWFLSQKPPETKPMHDHTTGLCKTCEGFRLNYETALKVTKKNCDCQTRNCENFFCCCLPNENGDLPAVCGCPVCDCQDCLNCKVGLNMKIYLNII